MALRYLERTIFCLAVPRALLAACILMTGIHSPAICIEPDGAAHVASADHLCCDPPAAAQAPPQLSHGGGEPASIHICEHALLGHLSVPRAGKEVGRGGAAPAECAQMGAVPAPDAGAVLPAGAHYRSQKTPRLSPILRL